MKHPVHAYISFVAAFVLMIFLSQKSEELRIKDRAKDVGERYLKRSKPISGGFDAVLADFIWMRTNLSRQMELKTKGMTEQAKKDMLLRIAEKDYNGYAKVVSLDPTFKKAYRFGILRVMTELPDKAISMAELAMQYLKEDVKEFAELAGHISSNKKDYKLALKFYEKSVSGGPEKAYIGRKYLRTLVRLANLDPYSKDLMTVYGMIKIYDEAHRNAQEKFGTEESSSQGMNDSWVKPTLLKNIKEFLGRVGLEKNDVPENSVKEVKAIYASLAPSENVCTRCYHEISPGDRFCSNCGLKTKVYGVCPHSGCHAVLKGPFCHVCGRTPSSAPIKKNSSNSL